MEEKDTFNKNWAIVEVFKSICIRNSSYNATEPINKLWEKAKELVDDIYSRSKD